MNRFISAALVGLALAGCAAPIAAPMAAPASAPVEQRAPAPALEFQWISEEGPATLADMRGRVVLLEFWATW